MARHSFLCRAVLPLATKSFRCGCWTKGRDFGRVGEKKRGNTDMDLAQRIRALRQQRELSQEALAERMEVSRQAVTKWEKGTARPSTEKLLRLSQVLEVPLETLVGTEPAARRGRRNVLPEVLCRQCDCPGWGCGCQRALKGAHHDVGRAAFRRDVFLCGDGGRVCAALHAADCSAYKARACPPQARACAPGSDGAPRRPGLSACTGG